MTPMQAAAMMVELPDESIPEWYVVVVGHLNGDGEQAFKYNIAGDVQYGSVIFALESMKARILSLE